MNVFCFGRIKFLNKRLVHFKHRIQILKLVILELSSIWKLNQPLIIFYVWGQSAAQARHFKAELLISFAFPHHSNLSSFATKHRHEKDKSTGSIMSFISPDPRPSKPLCTPLVCSTLSTSSSRLLTHLALYRLWPVRRSLKFWWYFNLM